MPPRWYADYIKMLDIEKPDMAIITTPSGSHLEPTLACAARKIHVLSDKPLEITLPRCNQMISACEAAGVQLGCIFQSRFTPSIAPLREAAAKGTGTLPSSQHKCSSRGSLHALSVDLLYRALWLDLGALGICPMVARRQLLRAGTVAGEPTKSCLRHC